MKKGFILATILIILVGGAGVFLGFLWGNDFKLFTEPTTISPIVDGVIDEDEWRRATYYNIPFYLDVDNSIDTEGKQNVDGWNYLSVAEDDDYYYVALDLCSDRTGNTTDEWISFFLANRLPEIEFSMLPFVSIQDYGLEYIYYDVMNDQPMPYQLGTFFIPANYYDVPFIPEVDTLNLLAGSSTSDYVDFWYTDDGQSFSIASEDLPARDSWLNGSYVDLQFGINVTQKFPDLNASLFLGDMTSFSFNYAFSANIPSDITHTTIAEEMVFVLFDQGPSPRNFTDTSDFAINVTPVEFQAGTPVYGSIPLNEAVNVTDGMYYFTLHCWNEFNATYSNNYEFYVDHMSLRIETTRITNLIDNTIGSGNYDIAWSLGSSVICSEEHRMFEFKIAKSEFPSFEDDILYLLVAGYGTMSFVGTNYWTFPGIPDQNPINSFIDHQSDFIALDMSIT